MGSEHPPGLGCQVGRTRNRKEISRQSTRYNLVMLLALSSLFSMPLACVSPVRLWEGCREVSLPGCCGTGLKEALGVPASKPPSSAALLKIVSSDP